MIKHSGHLGTLEKCRKHSPAARVFYISLVFSNARRVLSQCNTRLRLLYLLNIEILEQKKSFRVHTTLLASMCHAMPFSARAPKKNICFDVDIVVKNKSKRGLSWSVLLPTTSTCHYSFPKHFFRFVSAYYASL